MANRIVHAGNTGDVDGLVNHIAAIVRRTIELGGTVEVNHDRPPVPVAGDSYGEVQYKEGSHEWAEIRCTIRHPDPEGS